MEPSDAHQDKDYEDLNEAILKAIISSRDVRMVLRDFATKKMIDNRAVLNLILSLEELSDLVFRKPAKNELYKFEPADTPKGLPSPKAKPGIPTPSNNQRNLIDGQPLSKNEISFEEYCQSRFNEEQWLTKAKIKR